MDRKETKDEGNKAKHAEFGSDFKQFGKIFEKMGKWCMGQEAPTDCCAAMGEKMKEMMGKCCGPKPGDNK